MDKLNLLKKGENMQVINLWGSPSSGKSTTAAGLFFLMKINKMKVELVTEYAKDLIWDNNKDVFGEQTKIFAEQNHRLERLKGKVDYAITDSPLPLTVFYEPDNYSTNFEKLVMEKFSSYNNINFFLNRISDFENFGRIHSENQSKAMSEKLKKFIKERDLDFIEMDATPNTPSNLLNDVLNISGDVDRRSRDLNIFNK